ncbi:MAG: glycosyltransferase family 4 protein [Planctomycetota bacterium]|jgi:glycosyltransferase involved in cell wall biosynthesis|nr:glycosyltransferase family 4 protein [Planctomycetota bacterium]
MPDGPKILHLLPLGHTWETVVHVVRLAAALATLGLPQALAGPADSRVGELANGAGLNFLPLAPARAASPLGWLELARRIRSFRPDLAHAHGPEAALSLSRAAWLGGRVRVASTRYRLAGPSASADCGRGVAAAVCPSAAAAEWLAKRGADRKKLAIIPAGADCAAATEAGARRDSLRAKLRDEHCPAKEKPLFMVNIAALTEESGQAEIIEAAGEAVSRLPQLHLFIMGDGNLEEELSRQSRIMAMAGEITFLAPDPAAVPGLLAAADLYVSASRGDAAGLMARAALASGRAAVLSDAGCHPELADGGRTALLAKPDAGGLTTAVRELLEDRNRRERLGRQAGEQAARNFSLAGQAEKLAELYRSLV